MQLKLAIHRITAIRFGAATSVDGTTLIVSNSSNSIFYDVATGESTAARMGARAAGDPLRFSPDGKFVANARLGIELWSVEKREQVAALVASGNQSTESPRFSSNGRVVVTRGGNGIIRIWELPKLEP